VASDQTHYDIVIIGAGIGGYPAAIRAAQLGARVAVVEKQYVGGTCLNVGCIPSKALLHVGHLFAETKEFGTFGIELHGTPTFDMPAAVAFKNKVVKQLTGGVAQVLKANGITVIDGTAEALSSSQVRVTLKSGGTQDLTAGKLILANGSVPVTPPFPGIDGRNVIYSDDVMDMQAVPESLVCIGGGIIAVELACFFNAIGTKVTIVEMLPSIIAPEDEEVRNTLVRSFQRRGIEIHTNARVESISDTGNLKRVTAQTPDGPKTYDGEYVLVAVGRRSNTTGLDALASAGLAMDRGRVIANERMETNLPGVYAIGDLVGKTWLAHVAEAEGEVAAENAMGHAAKMDYSAVPRPIYTWPEIASVGITQQQAQQQGETTRTEKFPFAANGKALASAESEGFVKVVLGSHDEILGASIIGPDATNLITEYSLAMRAELTADEVIATIHPHPTYSEALREAVLTAEGRPMHIFRRPTAAVQR
jgi:dihydrolipoamide dehydrogenase